MIIKIPTPEPITEGVWVRVKSGIVDFYRLAGFSRWLVTEIIHDGSLRLYRNRFGDVYNRTVEPHQLDEWEVTTPPTAWAP